MRAVLFLAVVVACARPAVRRLDGKIVCGSVDRAAARFAFLATDGRTYDVHGRPPLSDVALGGNIGQVTGTIDRDGTVRATDMRFKAGDQRTLGVLCR